MATEVFYLHQELTTLVIRACQVVKCMTLLSILLQTSLFQWDIDMHIERISKWIDSLGGPLMFMPLDDTLYWMDIREKARNRLKDYDWVNRFESGSKVFFILGGEPLSTCVARSTDLSDYYFLWRWEYADEGFEIPEEISLELLSEIEPPVLFSSQQHSQNYLLCDPYNLETSFVDEAVTIKLEPLGAIYTYAYRPDSKTSFIVHAFQRMESAV